MIHANGSVAVKIHFFADGRIVCMPNLQPERLSGNALRMWPLVRSDDVRAVNCAACQRTEAFHQAAAALRAIGEKV